MNINSNSKTLCLLGHPVSQSFSPSIQNHLFKKYNLNKLYVCFNVKENNLGDSIDGIKALGILGGNITIPHKVNVIEYLDWVDENSRLIGAVNTFKNEDGILKGYNTDGKGFVKSIIDKGYDLNNKKIMVLGAGGASRSICIELASRGVEIIYIRNRSIEKPKEISEAIMTNFDTKVSCSVDKIKREDLDNIDILINTTPIGMGTCECPIDEAIVPSNNLLVCDIVYKPHNTQLLKWASKHKLQVIYGIDMLINQGLEAFHIWTGIKPIKEDEDEIKHIYEASINI
ncbi:shikimate dehydrogenase [Romboutsia weinsteinii]|uniref:Shikimate dehydrogenase (NADP(+)) n=1 Tax=Romboutsia weinsteinii TaxID=2020949 RepID=A0A371J7J6_9FIRM|nr:shikimate dehydrogenase [Romboutsia weinsteinii]RDY28761.1 shikimate dehydrogenase [Romboutsia weinsteinii]